MIFILFLTSILISLCSAACGPDGTKVTLDDDYFNITSSNIKFDENTFKGKRNSSVEFLISGNASHPKFAKARVCFRVKCASKVEHGTQAPPSETTCKTVNGTEICEQNAFNAVGGVDLPEQPCEWNKFCIKGLPFSISVGFQFTYATGCICPKVRGKKFKVQACVEN